MQEVIEVQNVKITGNLPIVSLNSNMARIEKLGLEKVELIEANQERGNCTVEYLQRLIKVFRKKIKLYKKFRGI